MLVADYSYSGTEIGDEVELLCEKYEIELNWNSGLELNSVDFPINFRGANVPEFAQKIGKDRPLNAYILGEAAKQMPNDHENLQMLKYLWHCIVRFGKGIEKPAPDTLHKNAYLPIVSYDII